jgi:hypothetical protein
LSATKVTVAGTALTSGTNGGLASNYSIASGQSAASSITAKVLTATVAGQSKTYDGTTTAATPVLTINPSALVGSETVTASGVASFDSKDVLTATKVTVAGTTLTSGTNGGLASNYSIASGQSAASSITSKALTATVAGQTKVYDGTTVAVTSALAITGGLVGNETVTASGTASFNSKDAASADRVIVGTTVLANGTNGGLANNYSLVSGQTAAGSITPKTLTTDAVANNKIYDGNTNATLTGAGGGGANIVGLVGNETLGLSGQFANKEVGNGKAVTASSVVLVGNTGLAGNYTLVQPANLNANITVASMPVPSYILTAAPVALRLSPQITTTDSASVSQAPVGNAAELSLNMAGVVVGSDKIVPSTMLGINAGLDVVNDGVQLDDVSAVVGANK